MKISRLPLAATVLAFIIIMGLMMTVVPGCQGEVKPTETIVLYTSVPTDIIDEVKAEFEKRQPGVELDIFRSGTGTVMDKIYEEIELGKGSTFIFTLPKKKMASP